MMNFTLSFALLLLVLCGYALGYPCGGSSRCSECSSSSCCSSSSRSSCCHTNTCCESSSRSSCCDSKQCCQSSSCCESTSSCCDKCNDKCCCPCPEVTPIPTRPTQTPYPPITYPPPPIIGQPPSTSSLVNNNTNNNSNNITIPTNINVQNEIRSETHVSIPVSVHVNNANNIDIRQASESTGGGGNVNCSDRDDGRVTERPCANTTIVVTVRVPVPFPVYRTIPVPYIVTIPKPYPVPVGCCQVVQPCIPYHYGGCQTSNTHCSHQCSSSYMYQPHNVCDTGCFKRSWATGSYCGHHGGCYRGQVDCSSCHGNFYESYEKFMMCSGCFVPMPWGMTGSGGWGMTSGMTGSGGGGDILGNPPAQ